MNLCLPRGGRRWCALPRLRLLIPLPLAGLLTGLLAGLLVLAAAAPAPAFTGTPYAIGPEWRWPLAPRPDVVNVFDAPDGPYARGHRGADLLGRAGQPVLAVAGGTVVYAGKVGGIGVVSIDTSTGRVTYQPVLAQVRRGEDVAAGSVLGRLTTTGGHCLPQACLHLGLIVAGEYRDPMALLGGAAVRLLPVDGPLASGIGTATSPVGALRRPAAQPTGVDALAVGASLGMGRW